MVSLLYIKAERRANAPETGRAFDATNEVMRQAVVVSSLIVLAVACGGRSEFFEEGASGSGNGGSGGSKGGSGGSSAKGGSSGTGGVSGSGATGGFGGTGNIGAVGGFGATGGLDGGFGGTGNIGAVGGFGALGGVSGVGAVGGVGAFGGVSGVGARGGTGGSQGGSAGKAGAGGVAGVGGVAGTSMGGSSDGGFAGASPENCSECLGSACPAAVDCFANSACIKGTLCGLGSCTGTSGSAQVGCWLMCFNGDPAVAFQALEAALCLNDECSLACQGFTP